MRAPAVTPAGIALAGLLWALAGVAAAQPPASSGGAPATSGEAGRFSAGAEALVWWFKGSPTPVPLVTDGLLGRPGTSVLLGGGDLDTGTNPGFRLNAGYALTEHWGLAATFLYIPSRSASRSVSSSGELGSTDLIVPFIDATRGVESGTEISFAPIYRGEAREELRNDLLGVELNGTWAAAPAGRWGVDLLGGFRYLRLREAYLFTTSSPFIPPFPADIWTTRDEFDTTNSFYGAQVGGRARLAHGPLFATAAVKVGLGAMVQSASIAGELVTNDFTGFGSTQTFPGGYFALPTSIGSYRRTAFAVVPEVGLTVGYRMAPWASIVAGYSFVYASSVIRPGEGISRTINPTQSTSHTEDPSATLQGPAQPSFRFKTSDFWAQGLNVGVVLSF